MARDQRNQNQLTKRQRKNNVIILLIALVIACIIIFFFFYIYPKQQYKTAGALLDKGEYYKALVIYEDLGNYKDSVDQIVKCREGIIEQCYLDGVAKYQSANFEEALYIFNQLGSYKNCQSLKDDCNFQLMKSRAENYQEDFSENLSDENGLSSTTHSDTEMKEAPNDTMELADSSASEENPINTNIPEGALNWNSHYYSIFEHCNSWEEAAEYCESIGGHLATITSADENEAVFSYMNQSGYGSAYFGLSDSVNEGTWTWITGENIDYVNWNMGEPNAESSTEDYAMFYHKYSEGTWNDGDFGGGTVGGGTAFICEWD